MVSTSRTRPPRIVLLSQLIAAFLLLPLPLAAQQKLAAASLQDKSGAEDNIDPSAVERISPSGISNDRLFYALPNFLTVDSPGKLQPLTTQQKFRVVARSSFDYVEFPWYAFRAGLSQAQNSEPAYGQGLAGYGPPPKDLPQSVPRPLRALDPTGRPRSPSSYLYLRALPRGNETRTAQQFPDL